MRFKRKDTLVNSARFLCHSCCFHLSHAHIHDSAENKIMRFFLPPLSESCCLWFQMCGQWMLLKSVKVITFQEFISLPLLWDLQLWCLSVRDVQIGFAFKPNLFDLVFIRSTSWSLWLHLPSDPPTQLHSSHGSFLGIKNKIASYADSGFRW